ncbi:unnamed protein product [Peniophora sp. CBMAI 1063]|nr:unnamed protein product [Peniophora sp. CBMAI 1063]
MFFPTALQWPDDWFRHIFRVSRPTFDRLVYLLEGDPVFRQTGPKPPRPVRYQLGTFLIRYGMLGTDALRTAMMMGISKGAVYDYCRRVTRALRKKGLQWTKWGDRSETKQWVARKLRGLGNCVGMLDGSLIQLTEPPAGSFGSFFCRKKFPALNIQVIVDHLRRIIDFDLGWPGSLVDVMLWKKSWIWEHRDLFFAHGEFVLADKGYPSSPFVLRPFTQPEVDAAPRARARRMRRFNYLLSSARVRVEQAFGLLKARFPGLKLFGTPTDIEDAYRVIEALIAVHNFCIDIGDRPEDIPMFDMSDDLADAGVHENRQTYLDDNGAYDGEDDSEEDEQLRRLGLQFREAALDHVVPPGSI